MSNDRSIAVAPEEAVIPARGNRKAFLFLSQVYVPDPAAVGQQMADAAEELVRRGHRVIVYTADRGYDDPSVRYPRRETIAGVEVVRFPFSSLGKSSIAVRLLGGAFFVAQAIVRGLLLRRVDAVVISTVPPLIPIAALVLRVLRRIPFKYWVMDLNPDQLVALGVVGPRSLVARVFDGLNRRVLARASDVVVLDRFMADRVNRKLDVRDKMEIIPPWAHEQHVEPVPHHGNPFRERHGLEGKLVVMYSGNHGPSNPITTILEAARRLQDDPDVVFLFVGGGVGKREVEAAGLPNVRSLPYQPLSELRYSLSAADVHVVTVGDAVVGIVHPSKVYGAMAVARPILLLGPPQCHVSEVIAQHGLGWHIHHGDVDRAVEVIRQIKAAGADGRAAMGRRARGLIEQEFSKPSLCGRFCDVVERDTRAAFAR